jgi:DNA primase
VGRITQETIERIKERLPVSAVVGKRVQLKRAGREMRGLSPFNKERTPSFFVNDQKGFWHCFSSGKHGNIFDFICELEGFSFVEAVERLAHEAGVEVTRHGVTREAAASNAARTDALECLGAAQEYFEANLQLDHTATHYLNERGLRRRICAELGVGWAPPNGRLLVDHLADHGFSVQAMLDAGLVTTQEGRAPYSFFRGRVTFPIRNRQGEVIGFGARSIDGSEPKYLNTRETPVFDKGSILYNLDKARRSITELGVSIVMEGYIDVASVSQEGIKNVVAPLGTALSIEHLHQLWRVAPDIVYLADGDSAGLRASARTLETALPWIAGDRRLSVAYSPPGLDPDDIVRASGKQAFLDIVRHAEDFASALWRALREETPGDRPEDRARIEALIKERVGLVADEHLRKSIASDLLRRSCVIGTTRRQSAVNGTRRLMGAIPAREAALVVGAVLHPQYAENALEALASAEFQAPLCAKVRDHVVNSVSLGQPVDMEALARDVAVLRNALPQPTPTFLVSYDPDRFASALDLQSNTSNKRRLSTYRSEPIHTA